MKKIQSKIHINSKPIIRKLYDVVLSRFQTEFKK